MIHHFDRILDGVFGCAMKRLAEEKINIREQFHEHKPRQNTHNDAN